MDKKIKGSITISKVDDGKLPSWDRLLDGNLPTDVLTEFDRLGGPETNYTKKEINKIAFKDLNEQNVFTFNAIAVSNTVKFTIGSNIQKINCIIQFPNGDFQAIKNNIGDVTEVEYTTESTAELTFKISGTFGIQLNDGILTDILNWGEIDSKILEFQYMFNGFVNSYVTAIDVPNLIGTSIDYFFYGADLLEDLFISNWDTSNITSMIGCFKNCKNINVDVSRWDISNVIDSTDMFNGCLKFNNDISKWNTSKLVNISRMFKDCELFNQDLSNWNLENVVNMNSTFSGCNNFNSKLTNWKLNKVVGISELFKDCFEFNQDLPSDWNLSNVRTVSSLFEKCYNFNGNISCLKNLNNIESNSYMFSECANFNQKIPTFKLSTNSSYMFYKCESYNQPISLDLSNVENIDHMFYNCFSFNQPLQFSNNIKNMNSTFYNCKQFDQDLNFDGSNIEDLDYTFYNCYNFNGDITKWNLLNLKSMLKTFYFCDSFTQDLSSWRTPSLIYMRDTFKNSNINLTFDISNWKFGEDCEINNGFTKEIVENSSDLSKFDISKLKKLNYFFNHVNMTKLGDVINNWNVSNLINMDYLFINCALISDVDLGSWNISNVNSMRGTFQNSKISLGGNNIDKWNVGKCKTFQALFMNCFLADLDLSSWNVSNVVSARYAFWSSTITSNNNINDWNVSVIEEASYMFYNCQNFDCDISSWNMSKLKYADKMFAKCPHFNSNINSWHVTEIERMNGMFLNCFMFNQPLNNWKVGNIGTHTKYVYTSSDFSSTFYNCSSFDQDLSSWDVSNAKSFEKMFSGCSNLTGNFNTWNTTSGEQFSQMFKNCQLLSSSFSKLSFDNAKDISYMFYKCYTVDIDLSSKNINDIYSYMFDFEADNIKLKQNTKITNDQIIVDDKLKITNTKFEENNLVVVGTGPANTKIEILLTNDLDETLNGETESQATGEFSIEIDISTIQTTSIKIQAKIKGN